MKKSKSHEKFISEVYDLVGNEYTFLEEYTKAQNKLKIKHNTCGHIYLIKPYSFLRGSRCPKCKGGISKSHRQFKNEVFELVGNEYELLEEYINSKTKILIKHKFCGHTYKVSPSHFIQGGRCPHCYGNIKKTHEEFVKEVYELVGDEFIVIGEYKNANTKIKMKHRKCNSVFNPIPYNFTKGSRCPYCIKSRGESYIESILNQINLSYKKQMIYEKCKFKRVLPFDFLLNNKVLIEYDGELHFETARFSDNKSKMKKELSDRQRKDKIKNQYCIDNNIPLLRIPYWEFDNIEYILDNVLHHFNIKKLQNENTYNQEIVKRYLVDSNWNHDTYISWQYKENRYWLDESPRTA